MIRFESVELNIGHFHLGPVSLEIARGEHAMLVGPSGAGKSLVLELIAGFRAPSAGRVFIRGEDMHHVPPRRRRLGWVPQAHALFPHMSVRQNIAYGLASTAVDKGDIDRRVHKVAERLELTHLLDRSPPTLSGGERQRVALARALVLELDLLLLDEPFSSLERGRRRRLWSLVKEIHREFALTIVHVTHDLEEAKSFDRRVLVFVQGRCVQTGSLDEVLRSPADPRVASAFGTEDEERDATAERSALTSGIAAPVLAEPRG